jgi:hypothetical protein
MTVDSIRRVGLTWPATGSAKAGGMNAPTLAEIEQAFQEWISEARARGCPDDTGVAVYGPDPNDYPFGRQPGHMSVQWKAADDVVTSPAVAELLVTVVAEALIEVDVDGAVSVRPVIEVHE